MKIGSTIPPWRVPAFIRGNLTFSSLAHFQGAPLVLCYIPKITREHVLLLESQFKSFRDRNATLATFVSNDIPHDFPWTAPYSHFCIPLLTDPLNRLGRSLGLSRNLPAKRCETLFFDQSGQLEFRLIHDLSLQGFSKVLEITERFFSQFTPTQPKEEWQHLVGDSSNLEEMDVQSTAHVSP